MSAWDFEALTDSHCHVSQLTLQEWKAAHGRATAAGVKNFVFISTTAEDFFKTRDVLGPSWHTQVSLGTHPHDAKIYDISTWEKLFATQTYIAVGECGLDYYYDHSPRNVQMDVFAHQLEMARVHNKPAIAHIRDAHHDALPLIVKSAKDGVRGVVHCFSGTPDQLKQVLDIGWYVGFTGIVTFGERAENVVTVLRETPLNHILLETDSPYLTPKPHRGKPNEPSYLPFIAQKAAQIKGMSIEELTSTTTHNAAALFG